MHHLQNRKYRILYCIVRFIINLSFCARNNLRFLFILLSTQLRSLNPTKRSLLQPLLSRNKSPHAQTQRINYTRGQRIVKQTNFHRRALSLTHLPASLSTPISITNRRRRTHAAVNTRPSPCQLIYHLNNQSTTAKTTRNRPLKNTEAALRGNLRKDKLERLRRNACFSPFFPVSPEGRG